jgi:hypothetical protein
MALLVTLFLDQRLFLEVAEMPFEGAPGDIEGVGNGGGGGGAILQEVYEDISCGFASENSD